MTGNDHRTFDNFIESGDFAQKGDSFIWRRRTFKDVKIRYRLENDFFSFRGGVESIRNRKEANFRISGVCLLI